MKKYIIIPVCGVGAALIFSIIAYFFIGMKIADPIFQHFDACDELGIFYCYFGGTIISGIIGLIIGIIIGIILLQTKK